jgi:hypothetical protein
MQNLSSIGGFLSLERISVPRLEEIGPDSIAVNRLMSGESGQQNTVLANKVLYSVSAESYKMSNDIRAAFDEFTEGNRESFRRYFMLCPEFFDWDVFDMKNLVGNIRTRSGHDLFLETFQNSDPKSNQLLVKPKDIYTLPQTITDVHAVARSGNFLLLAQPHRYDDNHEPSCVGDVFAVQYSAMLEKNYIEQEHVAKKFVQRAQDNETLIGAVATHSSLEA